MKKAEAILGITSVVALGMFTFNLPGGEILSTFSLSALSLFYLTLSFALFNRIQPSKIFKKASYKEISKLRLAGAVMTGLFLCITTIGFLFNFQSWPGYGMLIIIGFSGLMISLSIATYKYQIGILKISVGLAFVVTIIGYFSNFIEWNGGKTIISVGHIFIAISLVIGLFSNRTNNSNFYKAIFKRVTIYTVFLLFLYFFPAYTLFKIKYRNYPEYVDAALKYYSNPANEKLLWDSNPDNDTLYHRYKEELDKMNKNK